nr:hypothetical protein [Candidatus Sigynarchaeota archaeon]
STDRVGNVEIAGTLIVRLDTVAGNTTITWSPVYGTNFVSRSTQFSLVSVDNNGGSGIGTIQFNVNNSGWQVYSGPFALAALANGTATVGYRCIDHAGNTETQGSIVVRVDARAPRSTIQFIPAHGIFFVNSSTNFSISAFDNETAVATIEYNINGTWQTYGTPFNLSMLNNGLITIEYRSVDVAGNVETLRSLLVYLGDSDPVVTTLHYLPAHAPNIVNNATALSLVATGIVNQTIINTTYRVNGSAWHVYTGPFNLTGNASGEYLIEFYSIDVYNNTEAIHSSTVILDATAPRVLGIDIPATSITIGQNVTIRITCDAIDYNVSISIMVRLLSPSRIVTWQIEPTEPLTNLGNGTYEYVWVTSGLEPGNYTIAIYITDPAGNLVRVERIVSLVKGGISLISLLIVIALLAGFIAIIAAAKHASSSKKIKAAKTKPKGKVSKKGKEAPVYTAPEAVQKPSPQPGPEKKVEAVVKKATEPAAEKHPETKPAPKPEAKIEKPAAPKPEPAAPAKVEKKAVEVKVVEQVKPGTEIKMPEKPKAPESQVTTDAGATAKNVDIKVVEQKLVALFKKHGNFIPSKTDIYNEMKDIGFNMLQIELAFDNLRHAGDLVYNMGVPRGWRYQKEEDKKT